MNDTDAFAAADDLAEFAVENAAELAELDRKPRCHWNGCPHGSECVHARTDAELERDSGEPHIDGWPPYSGLPPAAAQTATEVA